MPTPAVPLNLPQRAFPAQPRLDRYFASSSSEAARRRLVQCVLRGDGPALVLGAPGVGKTMLLEVLAADLAPKLKVVRLASTQLCTRRALLQAILHGLGAPYRDREEGELRLALTDLLADARLAGVALLVDEAQTLPVRLLEELRVLSNVSVGGSPQLRLVLAGTHALDEAFTSPELEAFSQRLVARCYLDPLSRDETAGYVRAHVAAAGGDPDRLLAGDAYEAILRASDGLPRLVNQVADRALVLAVEEGRRQLNAASISAAWSDLHQLAAPWQAPPASRLAAAASGPSEEASSIEFGLLDDDLESDEPAAPVGVWNAGDKLRQLAGAAPTPVELHAYELDDAEEEDDDSPCVAYAFPGSSRSTDNVDDELLREADSLFEEVAAATRPPKPAARNPFAEDFDEEEVVIDPFAELERVIPAAPEVYSVKSSELSHALAALDVPAEKPLAAAPARAVATVEALIEAAVAEDDILVVEPDEVPTPAPAARREDYAQLFAKLRLG